MIESFEDLIVWQKSIDIVEDVYRVFDSFPKHEQYRLVDQLSRAVVSIPSNIAEGFMRNHKKEYIQFLYISLGSNGEVITQLMIANRLKYISDDCLKDLKNKLNIIGKMLRKLIQGLEKNGN